MKNNMDNITNQEIEQEEPNVPTPSSENKNVIWHTLGGDEPTIDGADCLVLVGVDEDKQDCYEVLEWNEIDKAFKWRSDNGKNVYFPAHNFTKWAYVKDLVRLKTTEPMSPDMAEEIQNRRYELYQKPMQKIPEWANKEVKVPYCTSNPLLNGVK